MGRRGGHDHGPGRGMVARPPVGLSVHRGHHGLKAQRTSICAGNPGSAPHPGHDRQGGGPKPVGDGRTADRARGRSGPRRVRAAADGSSPAAARDLCLPATGVLPQPRQPRFGAAKQLLAAASDCAASAAERTARSLLREANLTGWRTHYRVSCYELDLAFPERQVAIEVDGWAWHHDARSFQRDRQRQNALVLAGWTVLRFTWADLNHRPGQVIAEIRDALGHDHRFSAATRVERG
jgi:very-short-patch-repair endonuclease